MQRLLMGGTVAGVMGMVVVAGVVVITGSFGGPGVPDRTAAALPGPDRTATAPPPSGAVTRPATSPPVTAPPATTTTPPVTTPPATTTATPPATTTPPAAGSTPPARRKSVAPTATGRRLDAAGAARAVRAGFAGARITEIDFEDGVWEVNFDHAGTENEIEVDPASGRLSGHEVEDD